MSRGAPPLPVPKPEKTSSRTMSQQDKRLEKLSLTNRLQVVNFIDISQAWMLSIDRAT